MTKLFATLAVLAWLPAAAAPQCMIVVNHEAAPVTLHGCVPAPDWTTMGCYVWGYNDDPIDPLIVTVPAHGITVVRDADEYSYRIWDDPKDVDVHWRLDCPKDLREFRSAARLS